jgi:hypothetical protein
LSRCSISAAIRSAHGRHGLRLLADAQGDFGADRVNLFAANLDIGIGQEKMLNQIASLGDLNIKAGDVRAIKSSIDKLPPPVGCC